MQHKAKKDEEEVYQGKPHQPAFFKTVHVDGDILVYKAGFASQQTVWYVRDTAIKETLYTALNKTDVNNFLKEVGTCDSFVVESVILPEPVEYCLHTVKRMLQRIQADTQAQEVIVHVSGSNNFRETVAVTLPYKGNRWDEVRRTEERDAGRWIEWLDATEHKAAAQPKPYHYDAIREYLMEVWGAVVSECEEADDALGKALTSVVDGSVCIATIDKDLDCIPGWHYDITKQECYYVTAREAMHNFFCQVLTGDLTDNIRGLPGVGKKTASAYLDKKVLNKTSCRDYVEAVQSLWARYFSLQNSDDLHWMDSWAAMKEVSELVWIRRADMENPFTEKWAESCGFIALPEITLNKGGKLSGFSKLKPIGVPHAEDTKSD